MGTKAVFSVVSKTGETYSKVIGMTMDGFPNELEYIAGEFLREAKKFGPECVKKCQEHDESIIYSLLATVAGKHPDWLFVDEHKNAQFVSYTGIFDPATSVLCISGENNKAIMKVIK